MYRKTPRLLAMILALILVLSPVMPSFAEVETETDEPLLSELTDILEPTQVGDKNITFRFIFTGGEGMGRQVGVPELWSANPQFVPAFQNSFQLKDAQGVLHSPTSITPDKTEMVFSNLVAGEYTMVYTNPYRKLFGVYATSWNNRSLGSGANHTVNVTLANNTMELSIRSQVPLEISSPTGLMVPPFDPALTLQENIAAMVATLPSSVTVYDPLFPTETYQARAVWRINTGNVEQFTQDSTVDIKLEAYNDKKVDPWDYVYQGPESVFLPVTAGEIAEPESFAVTFDQNYPDAPAPNVVITNADGFVTGVADPLRDGYVFQGWFTNPEGTSEAIDLTTHVFTEDTTLYAGWSEAKPEPAVVTFDYNYEGSEEPITVTADDSGYVSPPADPKRNGYRFLGWFDNPNAEGQAIRFGLTTFAEDTTVYAGWRGNTPVMSMPYNKPNTSHNTDTIKVVGYIYNIAEKPDVTISILGPYTDNVYEAHQVEAYETQVDIPGVYTGPGYEVSTTFENLPDGNYDIRLEASAAGVTDSILQPGQLIDTTPPEFTVNVAGARVGPETDMRTIHVKTYEGYVDLEMLARDVNGYLMINLSNEAGTANNDQIASVWEGYYEGTFRFPRAYKEGVRELKIGETILYYRAIDIAGNITVNRVVINRLPAPAWVTFDYNYEGSPEPVLVQANDNGYVRAPANPTRFGYRFGGWFDNPEGTGTKINFSRQKFAEDTTVYAKWIPNIPRMTILRPGLLEIMTGDTIEVEGFVFDVGSTPNVTIYLLHLATGEILAEHVVEPIPTDINLPVYIGPGYYVTTTFDMPEDGPYGIRLEAEAAGAKTSVLQRILVDNTPPEISITAEGAEVVQADDMPTIRIDTIDEFVQLDIVATDNWYFVEVAKTNEEGTNVWDFIERKNIEFKTTQMDPVRLETTYRLPRAGQLEIGEGVHYFRAVDMAGHMSLHRVIVNRKPLNVHFYLDGELIDSTRIDEQSIQIPKFKDLDMEKYVITSDGVVTEGYGRRIYIGEDDEVEIYFTTKPGNRPDFEVLKQRILDWIIKNRWLR